LIQTSRPSRIDARYSLPVLIMSNAPATTLDGGQAKP
jgi:hypothetical protein